MESLPKTDAFPSGLEEMLSRKVVGQSPAVRKIVPCIQMYQAGLSPAGRPAGIFLLLGTTGTGKTRTVEALAEVLHGSSRKVIRVDCGEFQMDHEIAKLIGSPPGYIGHRETQPILTQERLLDATSDNCKLSLVLFDEIEKAAPAVARLLLGILDKAILRSGDNTEVNFEKTLIFFTSNLGAREMMKELQPGLGFRPSESTRWPELAGRLESIALASVRKMYSPEFVNRIDAVITYQPLDEKALAEILDMQLGDLQSHVKTRLGNDGFTIDVSADTRSFLLRHGASMEYGARELNRTIYRYLTQPLATLVLERKIESGASVKVTVQDDEERLQFMPSKTKNAPSIRPTMLIVDDNKDFLRLLSLQLGGGARWRLITAQSAAEADSLLSELEIGVALLDLLLPDGSGIKLGLKLKLLHPEVKVIIMTGGNLTLEEDLTRRDNGFQLLEKPFLADAIVKMVEGKAASNSV